MSQDPWPMLIGWRTEFMYSFIVIFPSVSKSIARSNNSTSASLACRAKHILSCPLCYSQLWFSVSSATFPHYVVLQYNHILELFEIFFSTFSLHSLCADLCNYIVLIRRLTGRPSWWVNNSKISGRCSTKLRANRLSIESVWNSDRLCCCCWSSGTT